MMDWETLTLNRVVEAVLKGRLLVVELELELGVIVVLV
jgi:hypothetical protein